MFSKSSYEDTSSKIILKAKNDDNVTNIELNVTGDEEESFEDIDLDMSFKFDKKLEITEINDDNALILNNYSTEELEDLGNEIFDNLKNSSKNNSNSLIGNLVSYMMMFQ